MFDTIDWLNEPEKQDENDKSPKTKKTRRRKTVCLERSDRHIYRRAFSELNLIDCVSELKPNHSYHFLTGGDVDQLSYLRLALRHLGPLDHMLFSTWCMASEDVLFIREMIESGQIKTMDAYLGEIFPNSYKIEWQMMQDMYRDHPIGRIAVFKCHAKTFAGITQDGQGFIIESSANINTNPRTENGCITICNEGYEFYKSYFDGIKSFEE